MGYYSPVLFVSFARGSRRNRRENRGHQTPTKATTRQNSMARHGKRKGAPSTSSRRRRCSNRTEATARQEEEEKLKNAINHVKEEEEASSVVFDDGFVNQDLEATTTLAKFRIKSASEVSCLTDGIRLSIPSLKATSTAKNSTSCHNDESSSSPSSANGNNRIKILPWVGYGKW